MKFHHRLISGVATLAVALAALPAFSADLPDGLYATLDTTKGKIVVKLNYKEAPMTVANFVGLAEGTKDSNKPKGTKFYDGLTFHRVIPNFMIQGGYPEGTGRGGPGYSFPDETRHDLLLDGPGVLAMANSDPQGSKAAFSNAGHSNGSQFFITHKDTPWLNGFHTVFGHVVEGQDVVNKIVKGDKINTVTIQRVGADAKAFESDQAAFDRYVKEADKKREDAEKEAAAATKKQLEDLEAKLEKENPGKKFVTTDSGLKYIVLQEGTGESPKKGTKVTAHYTGKFADGRVFDSSVQRGQPISFTVGAGQVIDGWDEAFLSMKKGEKRVLIIPSKLAYGERGRGPIGPNTPLVFEVELVDF